MDLVKLRKECEISAFRAGGCGGQHQNVTDSAIRVKHLPTGIVVVERARRSQRRNLAVALERLAKRIEALNRKREPRLPTRKGRGVRELELAAKKARSRIKGMRRRPPAE